MKYILYFIITVSIVAGCSSGGKKTAIINADHDITINKSTVRAIGKTIELKQPLRVPASHPSVNKLTKNYKNGFQPMLNYNTEDGLALSSISCVYKDKKGLLWFGTYGGGVSFFDGKTFKTLNIRCGLSKNTINCMVEDAGGNFWFGTDGGGLDRYDGKTIEHFQVQQGLAGNSVRAVLWDSAGNRLWIGTNAGCSCYDGKKFTAFSTDNGLLSDNVHCIAKDSKGNIWVGTNGGVSCYNGRSFTNYTTADRLKSNTVFSIVEDNDKNIWLGTSGGINYFNGKQFLSSDCLDSLDPISVKNIIKGKDGSLWFATFGKGLFHYNGKDVTNYSGNNSSLPDNITGIAFDNVGDLWIGSFGDGVFRWDGPVFSYYTSRHGLTGNHVRTVFEDRQGNYWFGTDGAGLSKFDGQSFTNYTKKQGLVDNNVWCITQDSKGNLWLGTYGGGLSCFNGRSFTNYTIKEGLPSNYILCAAQDNNNNLWFGTNTAGIFCLNNGRLTNYTTKEGIANNSVWCSLKDKKGNLWFGTFGGGVTCFDGKNFTNFTTADGLANNTVLCIAEDTAGNIWFGTDGGGASRFDGKTFATFNVGEGAKDGEVYAIAVGKDSKIIFGLNSGLSTLNRFRRDRPASPEEITGNDTGSIPASNKTSNEDLRSNYSPVFGDYNQNTDYAIRDINSNAMLCDSRGVIWAGCGDNKLARIDYKAAHKRVESPLLFIESIKLNNEDVCWSDLLAARKNMHSDSAIGQREKIDSISSLAESVIFGGPLSSENRQAALSKFQDVAFDSIVPFSMVPQHLIIPYHLNQVTFNFSALQPSGFHRLRFQYKLSGYDKTWSPLTEKTVANYGNINEGTYTFQLRAQNDDGLWSRPVSYSFMVLPPWYRTWWMYSVYFLLGFGLIQAYIYQRQFHLRREKELLTDKIIEQQKADTEKTKIISDIIQRNQDLQQFSYIVSHNLRAPIANIIGLSDLFMLSKNSEDEQTAIMKDLSLTVEKLDDVIKDLNFILQVRNKVDERSELVKFSVLVSDIEYNIANLLQNEHVTISSDFSSIDEIRTIKGYLYSIFFNLISNSIKFSRPDADPVIEIKSTKENGRILLQFKDNGLGIDLKQKGEYIFGLYKRFHLHIEGKGMGLYMVKTQVEMLGGKISVESELNEGTTFTIAFDRSEN